MRIKRVATLRTAPEFRAHIDALGIELPIDDEIEQGPSAPLAQPLVSGPHTIGNRFAILPMEGWDGTTDGRPTDLVRRRWSRFGQSGAKLIWGGEAVAVRPDGRANPNQLILDSTTVDELAGLRTLLVETHEQHFQRTDDLLVGLQLTHSGRFARPTDKKRMAPQILYHHPVLDGKFGIHADHPLLEDDEIDGLIEDFVAAAVLAQQAGFAFVDIKHCHGYLGHEFLTAHLRPGRYGGSFENRTRFLRAIVQGIHTHAPGLTVGVRLSAFDFVPFQPDPEQEGRGIPTPLGGQTNGTDGTDNTDGGYPFAFGSDPSGLQIDLAEPLRFLDLLAELGIHLVCLTAGSPYYNPHIQRPALFPPSDGYRPPEDPLVGVARQINTAAAIKRARPDFLYVGSGYSYLQEWLPHVAQHGVRTGKIDAVGLGRMVLSYPELPAHVLTGRRPARKLICRTFSDCTTAPRNGLVSGCYPLDDFYKSRPENATLAELKNAG